MDQTGSLVDTNLKIYPSEKFIAFLETIPLNVEVPLNIRKYKKDKTNISNKAGNEKKNIIVDQFFTNTELELLNKIKKNVINTDEKREINNSKPSENTEAAKTCSLQGKSEENINIKERKDLIKTESVDESDSNIKDDDLYLTTSDVDWIYAHITERRNKEEESVPFLHELFQGTSIVLPENRVIKRNPVLEARCVKLRAQQEAREYRKMTKGVDNVRMRYPEDSISYQLKQLNRQLIAIGQFIISIFAGFLFGFRGIEWMIGNLDFGVRLLLGVMCALIIALAEIYFLAKKLNEELTMTETVQLGGPPKFSNQPDDRIFNSTITDNKPHQD